MGCTLASSVLRCCVLVALLVALWLPGCQPGPSGPRSRRDLKQFSLEEVIARKYAAKGFKGIWVSGMEFLFSNQTSGDIMKHDVTNSTTTEFVKKAVLDKYSASSYEVSADGKFLMIRYDQKPGFRHSSSAKCVLYDLSSEEFTHVASEHLLELATWAPAGHGLAFVLDSDLYYRSEAGEERRLTHDGRQGVVYNGAADWVYEEEVFGSGSAVWFSPDGTKLAFASFNDTQVRVATYWHYGRAGTLASQYPQPVDIRYPKPGTPNPDVSLKVVDLTQQTLKVIDLPAPIEAVTEEHILAQVAWTDKQVAAVWLNRVQNQSHYSQYTLEDGTHHKMFEVHEPLGWVDVERPVFHSSGRNFLTLLSSRQPEAEDDFRHLAVVSEGVATPLTFGRKVVTKIYGWDEDNKVVYYQATPAGQPSRRHVYVTSSESASTPLCLSCDVKTLEGNECTFASAYFSKGFSHYALVCSGPDPAHVGLHRTAGNVLLTVWEDNAELRKNLQGKVLPEVVDGEVEVPGGFRAQTRLLLPPGIDKSGATKYPMIIFVYAGPNSVKISDIFAVSWGTYLSTNRSIIYGMIDGRGSGLKGNNMLFSVYRRLGSVEIEDQISVTKTLKERHPFIDGDRVGIWGWSYGGYATAMALAQDKEDVFKCGASVAPVTSWLYYDSIYTERYMGLPTPEDNLAGYNASDVTVRVDNFRRKRFYLLHGNQDDNVHYMQSMMLTMALETADILFWQQSYPDENHSIGGKQPHLYHSMDRFWHECFDHQEPAPSPAPAPTPVPAPAPAA